MMKKLLNDILPGIYEFRKELHRHPEIAGQERWTCSAIRKRLAEISGVRVLPPFLETDTVAFIDGAKPGRNVTLRADIDALPVTEATGCDFASEIPGMMHACGHDVHTAVLVGVAEMLAARRDEFSGSVRLVFQPGEENLAMAKQLVDAGALAEPAADFSAALHCEPGMKIGAIGVRAGAMMSSSYHFKVTFFGQGGHGSRPHLSRNPLLAAASAVVELQNVISNRIDTLRPAVLSICAIHSGELDNVVPTEAFFLGTIRALDDDTRNEVLTGLREICEAVAVIHRMKCEVSVPQGYAATINSVSGAELARKAIAASGAECIEMPESSMASEDFSYFLLKSKDGVFVKLGVGENMVPLHNNKFLPPEEAIAYGIKYMTEIALAALK